MFVLWTRQSGSHSSKCRVFQFSRTNIVEHIWHIYEEGELDEESTCWKFRQVRMGETVRKLKIRQTEPRNIEADNVNGNKMMWSENLEKEFSDSLGGSCQVTKENVNGKTLRMKKKYKF